MHVLDIDKLLMDFHFGNAWSNDAPEDLLDYEDRYEILVELPGIAKKNIELMFERDVLRIKAKREKNYESEKVPRVTAGRNYSDITKAYKIPTAVDGSKIEAKTKDGILRVIIPKAEEAKPKNIKIN